MKDLRQTITNGLLFLIPITLLLIIFLKLYEILIKIATPLGDFIPLEKLGGVTIANLLVIVIALILCFIGGWLAQRNWAKNLQQSIENKILKRIPGYAIIQGVTNDLKATKESSSKFTPVLVRFDDQEQLCFQIETMNDGRAVIFVPGAPSPWSGAVVYVEKDRITKLDLSVTAAADHIKNLGLNSDAIFNSAF